MMLRTNAESALGPYRLLSRKATAEGGHLARSSTFRKIRDIGHRTSEPHREAWAFTARETWSNV